jgi:hypothetical protein
MASLYPNGYDVFPAHAALMNQEPLHDNVHINLEDAIEAIQAELGLNPSGVYATLLARLAALDTRLNAMDVTIAAQPRVNFVGVCSSQTVGAGATTDVATYDTQVEDPFDFYTGGASAVIPSGRGGKYLVSAWVTNGVGLSTAGALYIKVNGGVGAVQAIAAGVGDATVSRSFSLAAGSTVAVSIKNGHSASLGFTVTLEIVRLSD